LQTISVPYRSSGPDAAFLIELRRIYSAAVRTAYSNAREGGASLKQKDLRDLVKRRFAGGVADAWLLHCATLEGMDLRRARPDGRIVFGTRASLERRRKGLIDHEKWRGMRLRPLCSRGDKLYKGNRHFRLSAGGQSCIFQVYGRKGVLDLALMKGSAAELLSQVAELASEKKINVMFCLDDEKLHVTFDPEDLPDHPQRRRPVRPFAGRSLGIDLNPNWIGIAVAENVGDPSRLSATSLIEHSLVKLDLPVDASPELVRETLAAVADRAIGLARKHRCGMIVLEKGLGKLRSSGKNRSLNRLLNYWARTIFVQMLTRRARLAGIQLIEVWGGYSSTIGNLGFDAPDACAAACEIARRGIARLAKAKDVFPVYEEGCVSRLWKNGKVPAELKSWRDVHRSIKAAKIGYRRPHPDRPEGWRDTDAPTLASHGHAVVRLRRRHRPGLIFRPMASGEAGRSSSTIAGSTEACTRTTSVNLRSRIAEVASENQAR
jgi:IS605 OrfB family transposase